MFLPEKTDHGAVAPFEYLPAAAGDYTVGQMLIIIGGVLTAITAAQTEAPSYLCVSERTIETAGDLLPVTRVEQGTVYGAPLAADAADAAVGSLLQVSADGTEALYGTGADGCFEVVALEGTARGDIVYGRFRMAAGA